MKAHFSRALRKPDYCRLRGERVGKNAYIGNVGGQREEWELRSQGRSENFLIVLYLLLSLIVVTVVFILQMANT